MHVKLLTPVLLSRIKNKLICFIKKYGEQRITLGAIHWFEQLSSEALNHPGTQVLLALGQSEKAHLKIVGISGVANYGKDIALIVVHPHHRGQQIGQQLITFHKEQLGQYSCNVAIDNLSSLQMCFQAGLVAEKLFIGIKGKPTLQMTGGTSHCPESLLEL